MTEICLEIEDVFKFDSLEACKGKEATNVSVLSEKKLPLDVPLGIIFEHELLTHDSYLRNNSIQQSIYKSNQLCNQIHTRTHSIRGLKSRVLKLTFLK